MNGMKSLLLAGLASVSLGIGAASAQDGPEIINDYWATQMRARSEQMAVEQAARQAAELKATVDQAVNARFGELRASIAPDRRRAAAGSTASHAAGIDRAASHRDNSGATAEDTVHSYHG